MAASLITFPFRITTSGRVEAADQFSDRYIDGMITVAATTDLGERLMCIPFGVPNAAFGRLSVSDLQTCIDRFGPDGVTVTRVSELDGSRDGMEFLDRVDIEWTRSAS